MKSPRQAKSDPGGFYGIFDNLLLSFVVILESPRTGNIFLLQ